MGGMIRCIWNDYNLDLDKVENEINRTDSVVDFEEMYESIKKIIYILILIRNWVKIIIMLKIH